MADESISPSENGVYPKAAAECIEWPGNKGHQIYIELYALHVDGVWIGAYSYQMGGTDQRGGGGPLTKGHRYLGQPDHTDRQSCIADEAQRLLRNIRTSDCKQAPKIREWLESLISGPDQMDLFAA